MLIIRFLLTIVTAALVLTGSDAASAADSTKLRVMSYNLRYASPIGPNSWPIRRPLVKERILAHAPDLLGTQEGLYHQLKDLAADLPEYTWLGLGREGGSKGEFMAIFYKSDRFEPIEYDHYWLSDTPEVIGSSTWGNSVRRMVTWIRFKDKVANRELYFINTHFDHQVQASREKSAELVLKRVLEWKTSYPVILVGDFNAAGGSNQAYKLLVKGDGFTDAWAVAEHKGKQIQSFNGFHFPAQEDGSRIDWILYRGPVKPLHIEIDPFHRDKQYPSDHFPVICEMQYE